MSRERYMDGAIRRALAGQSRPDAGPCPDLNLTAAYLEGLLSAGERARIEAHAAGCPSCRTLIALSMKMSDKTQERTETLATASTGRRVLFRFSIPVSALAVLVLAAGVAVFLAWNELAKRPPDTELAEMRSRQELPKAPSEFELPVSPQVSQASSPAASDAMKNEVEGRGGVEGREPRAGHAPEASEVMVTQSVGSKADELAEKKSEAGHAAATGLKGREDVVLQRGTADARPEARATGGAPGGVVGGIMLPRPVEEAASRASEPAVFAVADRVGRQAAEVSSTTGESAAPKKEEDRGRQSGTAPGSAQARENPRDVLDRLASTWQDGGARDAPQKLSGRSLGVTARMKAGEEGYKTRLISGRTFEFYSGYWVDLECVKHSDSGLLEYASGSPGQEEIRRSIPGLDELKRTGIPVLIHWRGSNVVLH